MWRVVVPDGRANLPEDEAQRLPSWQIVLPPTQQVIIPSHLQPTLPLAQANVLRPSWQVPLRTAPVMADLPEGLDDEHGIIPSASSAQGQVPILPEGACSLLTAESEDEYSNGNNPQVNSSSTNREDNPQPSTSSFENENQVPTLRGHESMLPPAGENELPSSSVGNNSNPTLPNNQFYQLSKSWECQSPVSMPGGQAVQLPPMWQMTIPHAPQVPQLLSSPSYEHDQQSQNWQFDIASLDHLPNDSSENESLSREDMWQSQLVTSTSGEDIQMPPSTSREGNQPRTESDPQLPTSTSADDPQLSLMGERVPHLITSTSENNSQLPTTSRGDPQSILMNGGNPLSPNSTSGSDNPLPPTSDDDHQLPSAEKSCDSPQAPTEPGCENSQAEPSRDQVYRLTTTWQVMLPHAAMPGGPGSQQPSMWQVTIPQIPLTLNVPVGRNCQLAQNEQVDQHSPLVPHVPGGEDSQLPTASKENDPHFPTSSSVDDPHLPTSSEDDNPQVPTSAAGEEQNQISDDPQQPTIPAAQKIEQPLIWYVPPISTLTPAHNQPMAPMWQVIVPTAQTSTAPNECESHLPTAQRENGSQLSSSAVDDDQVPTTSQNGNPQLQTSTDDHAHQLPTSIQGDNSQVLGGSGPQLPSIPVVQNIQQPLMWYFTPISTLASDPSIPQSNSPPSAPAWQIILPTEQSLPVVSDEHEPRMPNLQPEDAPTLSTASGSDCPLLPTSAKEVDYHLPNSLEDDNSQYPSSVDSDNPQLPTSTEGHDNQLPEDCDSQLPTIPVVQNNQQPFFWYLPSAPTLQNGQPLAPTWQIILPTGQPNVSAPCEQGPCLPTSQNEEGPQLPSSTINNAQKPTSPEGEDLQLPTSTTVAPTPREDEQVPTSSRQADPMLIPPGYDNQAPTTPSRDPLTGPDPVLPTLAGSQNLPLYWYFSPAQVSLVPNTNIQAQTQEDDPLPSSSDDPPPPSLPEETVLTVLTDGKDAMVQTLPEEGESELYQEDLEDYSKDDDFELPTSATDNDSQVPSDPMLPTPLVQNQLPLMWQVNFHPASLLSTSNGNIQQVPPTWQVVLPSPVLPASSSSDDNEVPTASETDDDPQSPSLPEDTVLSTLTDGRDAMVQTSDEEDSTLLDEFNTYPTSAYDDSQLSTSADDCSQLSTSADDDSHLPDSTTSEEASRANDPVSSPGLQKQLPLLWQVNFQPASRATSNINNQLPPTWQVIVSPAPMVPTASNEEDIQVPTSSGRESPSPSLPEDAVLRSLTEGKDAMVQTLPEDGDIESEIEEDVPLPILEGEGGSTLPEGDNPVLPDSAEDEDLSPIIEGGNQSPFQYIPEGNAVIPDPHMIAGDVPELNVPRRGVLVAPHLPGAGGPVLPNLPGGGFQVLPNFPGGGVQMLPNLPMGLQVLPNRLGGQLAPNWQVGMPAQPLRRQPLRTIIDMFTRRSPLWNGPQEYEEVLQYIITTNLFE